MNEIEDYLQAADIGVVTSDSESFCLTVLEAMCFGCPSVATRVGGIPEVIEHGISGLLASQGNASEISSAIQSLIGDADRRTSLGKAAKRTAREQFSADAIIPKYEALYRRVCAK